MCINAMITMKESLSKVESSLGLAAGVGAVAYIEAVPIHLLVAYIILGFIGGYFGKKFLGNIIDEEKEEKNLAK